MPVLLIFEADCDGVSHHEDGKGQSNTIVVSTLPQGDSKGEEQHCSFQVVGGALGVGQQRVLANADGKASPAPPVSIVERAAMAFRPRSEENTAKIIPIGGWTSCQRRSCVGRGCLLVKE
jgi:hypothetical protein